MKQSLVLVFVLAAALILTACVKDKNTGAVADPCGQMKGSDQDICYMQQANSTLKLEICNKFESYTNDGQPDKNGVDNKVACISGVIKSWKNKLDCEKLLNEWERDFCFNTMGQATADRLYCDKIMNKANMEDCYIYQLRARYDPQLCSKLANPYKEGCLEVMNGKV